MSRTAQNKLKTIVIAVVILAGAGGVIGSVVANSPSHKVATSVNSQQQLTDIRYNGQKGVDALTLLKKHAMVQTKHYSFGDLVTSINGSQGNGPEYWTFYVNGRQANVGAGSYITKSTDKLEWKLQQL